jgi:hypothetical protein
VIITCFLYGFRALHYKGLLKTRGYYAKYKAAFLQKNDYDLVFLGSSRIEMHYDTRAADSCSGKNSFNLGLPGATVHEAYVAFKAYLLNNKPPKDLVYEIDFHAMMEKTTGFMEFNNFFPFLKNPVLLEELNRIDPRMKWFYRLPYLSLPYTGFKNLSTSVHGWLDLPLETDAYYYKGFFMDTIRPHLDYEKTVPKWSYINVSERDYLDSLVLLCKKNETKITFMTSPLFAGGYLDVANSQQITGQIRNIAQIHGIDYYNFSSLPFCNRRDLFLNHAHMNYKGTQLFTPWLCSVISNKKGRTALK